MKQEVEIWVNMKCEKCQAEAMAEVVKSGGVDTISVTGKDKHTLAFSGESIDSGRIERLLKKKFRLARLLKVNPVKEKKPEPQSNKQPEPTKKAEPEPANEALKKAETESTKEAPKKTESEQGKVDPGKKEDKVKQEPPKTTPPEPKEQIVIHQHHFFDPMPMYPKEPQIVYQCYVDEPTPWCSIM
ncbi:proteoglycan 4 isoform X1 [Amborella trichopoda]|uniref:HMA domain-containing protein n=2 Tax=Amborella trichopoda TaxID=13333 RepID=U5D9F8_AMBTC|nr:proteoglycan 4 isoform X1 [Amborella trichopoda]ERN19124.1 hypothetical protein AMTR_s00061p00150060 [Amborella trichopoda]|eukprot:XP_006857657.1 proteoglycan 4 isoform X1 [Amborella trichopoda]